MIPSASEIALLTDISLRAGLGVFLTLSDDLKKHYAMTKMAATNIEQTLRSHHCVRINKGPSKLRTTSGRPFFDNSSTGGSVVLRNIKDYFKNLDDSYSEDTKFLYFYKNPNARFFIILFDNSADRNLFLLTRSPEFDASVISFT